MTSRLYRILNFSSLILYVTVVLIFDSYHIAQSKRVELSDSDFSKSTFLVLLFLNSI